MKNKLMTKFGTDLSLATESIAFQSGTFGKELSFAIQDARDLEGKKEDKLESIVLMMTKLIKTHTNISVKIITNQGGPAVMPPMVDKNNVLINTYNKAYFNNSDGTKIISDAKTAARGSVDLATGKVHGVFETIVNDLYMPEDVLLGKMFTSAEVASITCHEVGHLITYYEYLSRSIRTNQALAGLTKLLDKSVTEEERHFAIITVKDSLKLKTLDDKELAKSTNSTVISSVIVTNIINDSVSELGCNFYDCSTWEYLADQYTARQGLGRDLATALDKLCRGSFNISTRSTSVYLAMEAFKLVSVLLVATPFFSLFGVALVFILIDGEGDGTYDKLGARIKRVKNQLVEEIKHKDTSKHRKESLLADIEAIENLEKNINDRSQFFGYIWDAVSPSARRTKSQMKLQKELENLASNDLFVKAESIKQLG